MSSLLISGQPAPWFHAAALDGNPRYTFSSAAGRWIVLLFLGSGARDAGQQALQVLAANRELFDDDLLYLNRREWDVEYMNDIEWREGGRHRGPIYLCSG